MSEKPSSLAACRSENLLAYKNSICDLQGTLQAAMRTSYIKCQDPNRKAELRHVVANCEAIQYIPISYEIDIAYNEMKQRVSREQHTEAWTKARLERREEREV